MTYFMSNMAKRAVVKVTPSGQSSLRALVVSSYFGNLVGQIFRLNDQ